MVQEPQLPELKPDLNQLVRFLAGANRRQTGRSRRVGALQGDIVGLRGGKELGRR
jgi:hypothetical protein